MVSLGFSIFDRKDSYIIEIVCVHGPACLVKCAGCDFTSRFTAFPEPLKYSRYVFGFNATNVCPAY